MDNKKRANEETIKKLEKNIDKAYDLFLRGGTGIKPGAIETYGAICGMKEVLEERRALAASMDERELGEE